MIDRHHILHEKKSWEARPQGKLLRSVPSLIPPLDRESHNALHAACPEVPMLGYYALVRIIREFQPTHDTLESMDDLMFSINEASKHPRAHDIERQLCQLALQAVDLQRPFIREGIVTPVRRVIT